MKCIGRTRDYGTFIQSRNQIFADHSSIEIIKKWVPVESIRWCFASTAICSSFIQPDADLSKVDNRRDLHFLVHRCRVAAVMSCVVLLIASPPTRSDAHERSVCRRHVFGRRNLSIRKTRTTVSGQPMLAYDACRLDEGRARIGKMVDGKKGPTNLR